MATLSVIVPNYNHARYLPEALTAVTSQSRPADEIIIIDDASTDNSVQVIESFVARYDNMRLIRNQVNQGPLVHGACALKEACGDYIYWAAADDRILPGFFEQSMGMLERYPLAGLCFSDPAVFRDGGEVITESQLRLGWEPLFMERAELAQRMRRQRFSIAHNTAPVKRSALREFGFEPDFHWHSDWFALLVIAFRHGACYIPRTLATLRVSPHSYSGKASRTREQQVQIYQRMLELLETPRYADVAEAFRESLVFATYGFQMWKVMGSDARWAKYRSPALLKAIVRGEMIGRLGAWSPRTQRLLSRAVNAWRGRSLAPTLIGSGVGRGQE